MDKNILILNKDANFKKAIELLDNNGNGILPVTDEKNKFVGIITDGDIRRSILNNNLSLEHIINKSPFTLNIDSSKKEIISFLKKVHRRSMPLVDDDNNFIKIFSLDDIDFNFKKNWVIIMAGGLGTRLGELTKDTPKPMLKIGDKPIIEHIIELYVAYGFTKFILCVNYKAEIIKSYFKDGTKFGIEIRYIEEKSRLGTGGALSLINFDIDEPFFVTNADVISSIDFESLLNYHVSEKSHATMCVRKESYQISYGVINIDNENNIIAMEEKPKYNFFINTGIYVLSPDALKFIPKDKFFDLPTLFEILHKNKKITKSYEIKDYWIDTGTPQDLNEARTRMEHYK